MKLEEGHVINLENGMCVYGNNREIKIGKTHKAGEYVVIKTAFDGGGTGHGPHDIYPNGHHVFCKALKNGKYDENGSEVNFYQSGCFTCELPDIEPIRKLKKRYIE